MFIHIFMALNTFSYKERKANVGTLLFKRKESSIKGSGGGGGGKTLCLKRNARNPWQTLQLTSGKLEGTERHR